MDDGSQNEMATSNNGQSKLIYVKVNVAPNYIIFFQISHSLGERVIKAFTKLIEMVEYKSNCTDL